MQGLDSCAKTSGPSNGGSTYLGQDAIAAQLGTPMNGNKFGWFTMPDIDDAVVVAFIEGDITQPIILGGVWSKPDQSPEPNEDGKNNFRGYRSRALWEKGHCPGAIRSVGRHGHLGEC